jgi:hypothetical protein
MHPLCVKGEFAIKRILAICSKRLCIRWVLCCRRVKNIGEIGAKSVFLILQFSSKMDVELVALDAECVFALNHC